MIRTPKLVAVALTVAASLALPGAGLAQNRTPSAARTAKTVATAQANALDVRMSKLIGMRIDDPQGRRESRLQRARASS